jgi:glucose/arabinose dehydrogenase
MVFENSPSATSAKVFLDIQSRVTVSSEEGLLGLAFHPKYATNGHFYVNYDALNPRRTVLARYSVSATDPDKADPGSEVVVLQFNQPYPNHKGGQLVFGKDGFLYIATGDGGSGGDPKGNGQSLNTLLGKILRIDVDNPSGGLNYGIPSDNPFAGTTNRGEIWAYGLRNPWRFSFDPVTDVLWAGDVGQDAIEEVDIIQKGMNYGWNIMEGDSCYNPSANCNTAGLVSPIWEYPHSLGNAVIGGFVYRGTRAPQLVGSYIYGDNGSGRIWSLRYDGVSSAVNTELIHTSLAISTFGVDQSNELYFCGFDGKIYHFK